MKEDKQKQRLHDSNGTQQQHVGLAATATGPTGTSCAILFTLVCGTGSRPALVQPTQYVP